MMSVGVVKEWTYKENIFCLHFGVAIKVIHKTAKKLAAYLGEHNKV